MFIRLVMEHLLQAIASMLLALDTKIIEDPISLARELDALSRKFLNKSNANDSSLIETGQEFELDRGVYDNTWEELNPERAPFDSSWGWLASDRAQSYAGKHESDDSRSDDKGEESEPSVASSDPSVYIKQEEESHFGLDETDLHVHVGAGTEMPHDEYNHGEAAEGAEVGVYNVDEHRTPTPVLSEPMQRDYIDIVMHLRVYLDPDMPHPLRNTRHVFLYNLTREEIVGLYDNFLNDYHERERFWADVLNAEVYYDEFWNQVEHDQWP
jgi:hypothetical protein